MVKIVKRCPGKHVEHAQCPSCASKGEDEGGDNLSIYQLDDGSKDAYCWKCKKYYSSAQLGEAGVTTTRSVTKKTEAVAVEKVGSKHLETVEAMPSIALKDRRIPSECTKFYGVRSEVVDEKEIKRYYPRTVDGKITGYKCRKLPKFFKPEDGATHAGSIKTGEFFGQSKFKAGGSILIITAGEEDAMAAWVISKEKSPTHLPYACVSAPNGAGSLVGMTRDNLSWVQSFDKVVYAVDQEEGDLTEAKEASKLLSPGKAFVATFSEKDASDMLVKGKQSEFYKAVWQAEGYKPQGLVSGTDTWEMYTSKQYKVKGTPMPPKFGLDHCYMGLVKGALDVIGAAEKSGKSTMLKEIVMHLHETTTESVALFMLEESVTETVTDLMVMSAQKRIDIDDKLLPLAEQKLHWDKLFGDDRIFFSTAHYFDSLEALLTKIRYLHHASGVNLFFIDNLTKLMRMIVTTSDQENFTISKIIAGLDTLTKELGIHITLVTHVRKEGGEGKSYSEGKVMKVHDLAGSGDISKFAHNVIAISRNNSIDPNITQYHLIATRRGKIGVGKPLTYNFDTGRMIEVKQEEIV